MIDEQSSASEQDYASDHSAIGAGGDAGGTKRDETHEVRCRPMVHNVDRMTPQYVLRLIVRQT